MLDSDEQFKDWEGVVEAVVKEGVKAVGEMAFYGCKNLIKAIIPEGVEDIDDSAFGSCEKLAAVTIPFTVKTIGDLAFMNTALKEVRLSRSNEYTIDEYARWGEEDGDFDQEYWKEQDVNYRDKRSFPDNCKVSRLELHIRATFLLCLKSSHEIEGAMPGQLDLTLAREYFLNSGEGVGLWRFIWTYV